MCLKAFPIKETLGVVVEGRGRNGGEGGIPYHKNNYYRNSPERFALVQCHGTEPFSKVSALP